MDKSIKKAITYSLLAHIRNSGTLSKGPLDIFVPLVKKALHFMNRNKGQYKGESLMEIHDVIVNIYDIDIPIPTLKSILVVIAKEINTEEETVFILNNDNSFWIKDYVFDDYDEKITEYQNEVNALQHLFREFCKANGIDTIENNCIVKFVEKNKYSISKYIANSKEQNGHDYIIEARFIENFKHNTAVFDLIKRIYLGSILTCYLDYQPTDVKMDVTLLLDTNFIISLIDLNTPESTHTCNKLLEVCKKIGYNFRVLSDTIDEIRSLINHKANNFDNAVILKFVNKEDIYNACERRKLSRTDLDRIADNIETTLTEFSITIIPHTEGLRNKAKFSNEYKILKSFRNTEKAALHDAEAIIYIKEKRGKRIREFEKVNCWFVNNTVSHDSENEGINPLFNPDKIEYQPEIIKVDDLLNILWLSNPNINTSVANDELVDIGLTSLVAFTLNQALPKARIIKELDVNIQKYKDNSVSDRDVLMLSTRISNGQFKEIEKLNELAKNNPAKFNEGIKEEAKKQEDIEKDRSEKFEKLFVQFNNELNKVSSYKEQIEKDKEAEIQKIKEESNNVIAGKEVLISERDIEIQRLRKENIKKENQIKHKDRQIYIEEIIKKWRKKSWVSFIVLLLVLVFTIIWTFILFFSTPQETDSLINNLLQNKIISICISICISVILAIVNYYIVRGLYDKYHNHSNINAFKTNINIPENLKDLPIE
jgi:hypothetical protein